MPRRMQDETLMLTRIIFDNFTAFTSLEVKFSAGINIFTGENSTGKTHILKALYAGCCITKDDHSFASKIRRTFLPFGCKIGTLVKRSSNKGSIELFRTINTEERSIKLSFTKLTTQIPSYLSNEECKTWKEDQFESVYLPLFMIPNTSCFRTYSPEKEKHDFYRNINFDEIYNDIIEKIFFISSQESKRSPDPQFTSILAAIQDIIGGRVIIKRNFLFFKAKGGKELLFSLLSDGYRKLGLLWFLLQNGMLTRNSVLLLDEPDCSLHPNLIKVIVSLLIEMQRIGMQIFLSTKNFAMLHEFELQLTEKDQITYHTLFRDADGSIACYSAGKYSDTPQGSREHDLVSKISKGR